MKRGGETVRPRCVMWKDGRCNSMYGKGIKCDGYNPPKDCPYNFKNILCLESFFGILSKMLEKGLAWRKVS